MIEEYYVCFGGETRKHWIQRLLAKGFYHCYAFKKSPGGQFYIVEDPTKSHTILDLYPVNEESFNHLTNNVKCIKYLVDINTNQDRGHLCRFNCVEVVKSLIGLSSFWTFTPKQLYKALTHGK